MRQITPSPFNKRGTAHDGRFWWCATLSVAWYVFDVESSRIVEGVSVGSFRAAMRCVSTYWRIVQDMSPMIDHVFLNTLLISRVLTLPISSTPKAGESQKEFQE